MRRIRNLAVIALAGTMALTSAACGDNESGGGSAGSGSKELTYWSMWKQGEPQQKVIAEAIDSFTRETGIKVNVQWIGRDVVKSNLPAALNTSRVPDLVDQASDQLKGIMGTQKQGRGLGSVYASEIPGEPGKKVSDVIPASYIDSLGLKTESGEPFMVPYTMTGVSLFYDAALLPDVAAKPPATWAEFEAALDKIKAGGKLAPLTADADQGWSDGYWTTYLITRELGPGGLRQLAQDKTGEAWRDPAVLKAAQRLEKLVKGGYFLGGYDASKAPEQQKKWAQGKAGFFLMGSWLPVEVQPYARSGITFASIPFPHDGPVRSEEIALFGFAVPAKAKHADAAGKFAAYFMNKDRVGKMASAAETLSIRKDVAAPASLAGVKAQIDAAPAFHSFGDGADDGAPGWGDKVYGPAVLGLIIGKTTAQQFVDTMVKTQAAYWKSQG
jgi:raffinose/stachyose/melibiose transport system substrate-binding protein